MPESGGGLLLDTHVWVWMVEGMASELSAAAIAEVEQASRRGALVVSAISVWEVAMLEAKGRLRFSRPVTEWVQSALRAPGLRLLELTPSIAVESTRLPGAPPGDPADRILMASARMEGGRLATRDRGIIDYAQAGNLAVLDVRT